MRPSATWTTRPISPTCEVLRSGVFFSKEEMPRDCMCGAPTSYAYPAMGGGWMALCESHGVVHLPQATHIGALIKRGERFEGVPDL